MEEKTTSLTIAVLSYSGVGVYVNGDAIFTLVMRDTSEDIYDSGSRTRRNFEWDSCELRVSNDDKDGQFSCKQIMGSQGKKVDIRGEFNCHSIDRKVQ